MKIYDVTIVGAGVMGAAAACELAHQGVNVILIDQASMPNPLAASVDHSKVFRFAYPDPFYVKLAVDALGRWRELESTTGTSLLTRTGALLIGNPKPSFETECYKAMLSLGLETELLDRSQVGERFPQFNNSAFAYAVFDPSGGILYAEAAVRALVDLARRRGVETAEGERVINIRKGARSSVSIVTESGTEIECERAMIASGPWSRKLLPHLDHKLTTTRQELVYFQPDHAKYHQSFEANAFPIFLELESGFYGFPVHHRGAMKIANHHKGPVVDPDSVGEPVGEQFIESCRAFFSRFIPDLVSASVLETRMCLYNNTPDDDFIVDWHPQLDDVLLVTGFSGHGFKFGPTIGRIAADLLIGGRTGFEIDRFRLKRFNNN
jgi:monomeric sarcosine oxidase